LPLNVSGWPSSLSSNTCNFDFSHFFILEILSFLRGKRESDLNAMLIAITSKNYQNIYFLELEV
jgi:hypothetical protein